MEAISTQTNADPDDRLGHRRAEESEHLGPSADQQERFVHWPEVRERIGKGRATIWRWEAKGLFPKRRHIGLNTAVWLASDIDAFIRGEWQPSADAA